jgi:hypothetical protein
MTGAAMKYLTPPIALPIVLALAVIIIGELRYHGTLP